jgi:cell division transport system permease protein
MLWISIKRVFQSGVTSFLRNSFVSLAAIFVMTMTVFIIGSLMFLNGMIGQFVTYVKDKVDVNVYFVSDASEQAIFDLTEAVRGLPEVQYVTYTSREEVLENFRTRHQGDQLTLQALDELGENPFGATLSIKAKEPSQYEGIAQFLNDRMADTSVLALIDEVNFENNRLVIERLERIASYAELFGYIVIALFAAASVLITFNTIRLAIYTAREEISVMRLVGASNGYIRGPFIVEGTLYGVIAGIVTLVLFFILTFLARASTVEAFGIDILDMYLGGFLGFFIVLVGSGALLGALSSFLAVRKYLSV